MCYIGLLAYPCMPYMHTPDILVTKISAQPLIFWFKRDLIVISLMQSPTSIFGFSHFFPPLGVTQTDDYMTGQLWGLQFENNF